MTTHCFLHITVERRFEALIHTYTNMLLSGITIGAEAQTTPSEVETSNRKSIPKVRKLNMRSYKVVFQAFLPCFSALITRTMQK